MDITPQDFRDALRHFAAGVTIVTSKAGERVHGMTVSAFTSISVEPPLVAVAIGRDAGLTPLLTAEGAGFAVNILAAEHVELSDRFAFVKDEDRFDLGRWEVAATGAPVLADALSWLDCRLEAYHEAGSHNVFLGRVVASRVRPEGGTPLVYWDRAYRRLAP